MRSIVSLLFAGALALVAAPVAAQTAGPPKIIPNSGHSSGVNDLAFAPNGKWLATGSYDSTVKLWNVESGRLLRTMSGHGKAVYAVAVTPDGRRVVSLGDDNSIKVWDPESGALVRTITGLVGDNDYLQHSLVLTRDGRAVYSVSFDAIRRIDLRSGAVQRRIRKSNGSALWYAIALSPDDRLIAAVVSVGDGSDVKLLNAANGRVVRSLGTYSSKSSGSSVVFSPDGSMVAVCGYDGFAKVWSVASGRLLHTLAHPQFDGGQYVSRVAFSSDSKIIVTAGSGGIKLWDAANGHVLRTLDDKLHKYANIAAFMPGSPVFISSYGSALILTDSRTGATLPTTFGQKDADTVSVASLKKDQWLEIGPGGIGIWDAKSGQLARNLVPKPGNVSFGNSQFWGRTDSGHVLAVTLVDNINIKVWDVTDARLLRTITWTPPDAKPCASCGKYFIGGMALSPDARRLAAYMFNDETASIRIWDVATGHLLRTVPTGAARRHKPDESQNAAAHFMQFTTDSRNLVAAGYNPEFKLFIKSWDVASGDLTRSLRLPKSKYNVDHLGSGVFAQSPDGSALAVPYSIFEPEFVSTVALLDARSGRLLRVFQPNGVNNVPTSITYSPDGNLVFVGVSGSQNVNVWEAASGRLIQTLTGNPGSAQSIAFSPDGRQVIVGNQNGTSSVWDMRSFRRLAITLSDGAGEWLTITPEGFFAASADGAKLLHVVEGFETTGIDQIYQALFRPDLVREKLAGDARGLVREAAGRLDIGKVMASGVPPQLKVLAPAAGGTVKQDQVTATVELAERGGGVGRVEWRVNGVTVGVDKPEVEKGATVKLEHSVALDDGDNTIEIVAYNGRNLIASEPAKVKIALAGSVKIKPRLYVLAIGISDYWDARLRLNFPVADAKALGDGFKAAGKELYEAVDVTTVLNADATVIGIDKVFATLSGRVRPRDVFVFFAAGHGKTLNGRYYFIPQDFRYESEASIGKQGISQEQFQAWFAKVPARKSILLFDTCESGTLTGDRVATRGLELVASLERLTRAMGRTVLSASTDDTPALEGYKGHGVFTYTLLDAMERARTDDNGFIDVTGLAAYVDAQVPAISQKAFNFRQVPQMKVVGSDFPLIKPTPVLVAAEGGPVVPRKATHVVIQPAEVVAAPQDKTVVQKVTPGTTVALVKAEDGWVLIARDGKVLGYVAESVLARIQ